MGRTLRNDGLAALAAATLVMTGIAGYWGRPRASVLAGLVILAGGHAMGAFAALVWSLAKSNRMFFTVFVLDGALRLAVLGAVTYGLWVCQVAFTVPLLTLAIAYLLLSLAQIPFFARVR